MLSLGEVVALQDMMALVLFECEELYRGLHFRSTARWQPLYGYGEEEKEEKKKETPGLGRCLLPFILLTGHQGQSLLRPRTGGGTDTSTRNQQRDREPDEQVISMTRAYDSPEECWKDS